MAIWMKRPDQIDWHPIAQWLRQYPRGPTTDDLELELNQRPKGIKVVPLFMRAKVKESE